MNHCHCTTGCNSFEFKGAVHRCRRISSFMASFFDLAYRPDRSIRSKTTGEFISLPSPPADRKVSLDWDVQPGDVLSWSQYRATNVFLFVEHRSFVLLLTKLPFSFSVTPQFTLLMNPDSSNAGYLTIPLAMSSLVTDALQHYSSVLRAFRHDNVTSIELSARDAFFRSHFSREPLPESVCQRDDLFFSFDPSQDLLFVKSRRKSKVFQEFPLQTTTTADILDWIATIDERRTTLHVSFRFEGENILTRAPLGPISGLPAGWTCEMHGGCSGSSTTLAGAWQCRGPVKTQIEARKSIEKYYEGFSVEIY